MASDTNTSSQPAVIFTQDVLLAAKDAPPYSARLLYRLASIPGEEGSALRRQLERCAALVPLEKRARILGPLLSPSAPDDQGSAVIGCLLLAKTLNDSGWLVEFEPEVDGGTPDFHISRGPSRFIVEVRRVAADELSPAPRELARLRGALHGLRTHNPISLRGVQIDGGSSVKPFVSHLKELLDGHPEPGLRLFNRGGVYVQFRVHEQFEEPMPVLLWWSASPRLGSRRGTQANVQKHINEKLGKYKVPLVVALDLVDPFQRPEVVEEALFGQEVLNVPVDLSGDGRVGETKVARAADGLFRSGSADAERARRRLIAVLPFSHRGIDTGEKEVRARILINPFSGQASNLKEFSPMPRLIVTSQNHEELLLRYVDAEGKASNTDEEISWSHVP